MVFSATLIHIHRLYKLLTFQINKISIADLWKNGRKPGGEMVVSLLIIIPPSPPHDIKCQDFLFSSRTGWKYILPTSPRFYFLKLSGTGWKYILPTSTRSFEESNLELVGNIYFRPVQVFICLNYLVLVGSIYVPDQIMLMLM